MSVLESPGINLAKIAANHWEKNPGPWLRQLAATHPSSSHQLFGQLDNCLLTPKTAAALLKNYDAHATALRRLLLKAATIMPEEAVGFILENVRNEYGNGNPEHRHQLQLLDVARQAGVSSAILAEAKIHQGVRSYIRQVTSLYYPIGQSWCPNQLRPAIAGGAIAATELLALSEFAHMQKAFAKLGLGNHVWFDHLNIEVEHGDESLALSLYFIKEHGAQHQVEFGMKGVLAANLSLYDGLLAAIMPNSNN